MTDYGQYVIVFMTIATFLMCLYFAYRFIRLLADNDRLKRENTVLESQLKKSLNENQLLCSIKKKTDQFNPEKKTGNYEVGHHD